MLLGTESHNTAAVPQLRLRSSYVDRLSLRQVESTVAAIKRVEVR